jgi:hypothetical protein
VHTAAAQVEEAGGRALAEVGDVRNDDDVAGAWRRRSTREIDMKKYDLMQDIHARGTFLLFKTVLSYLEQSDHAHTLTLSPPLDRRPQWAAPTSPTRALRRPASTSVHRRGQIAATGFPARANAATSATALV